LLDALSDLRSVQNNVMSVWLAYYASHMTLIRDLGVMQLDDCGLWVAQPLDQFERMGSDECLLPPSIPEQWFKDLDAAGATGASGSGGTTNPALPPPPAPRDPVMGPDAAVAPTRSEPREESRWWPLRRKEPVPPRAINVQAVSAAREAPPGQPDSASQQ
jgi:hypothetical protein